MDNNDKSVAPTAQTVDAAAIVAVQHRYFNDGKTLDVNQRIIALRRLYDAIKANEGRIASAMRADLGKSPDETCLSEVGLVLMEISYQIAHVRRWSKPRRRMPSLLSFPSSSVDYLCPKGVVFVMSPWNYPFMLALDPLVGAVAAGNCVIVKPSDYSPHVSRVIADIVAEVFPSEHVTCVLGHHDVADAILEQPLDHVFFTGSKKVGAFVMGACAKICCPVTLELGGQSPCIVGPDADIDLAARRIVFGKFLNCGQTCVCPNHVFVHKSVHDRLMKALAREVRRQYGERPLENPAWGHICKQRHYERIAGLIDPAKVVLGGGRDPKTLQIEPTIMDRVALADPVMADEIFGPVLPVLTYSDIADVWREVAAHSTPLAAYLFTHNAKDIDFFRRRLRFGSGCVNDTVMQLSTSNLGFGGDGASGMGRYHGKYSFDTFSDAKGVLTVSTRLDMPFRYQPYTKARMAVVRFLER
ncbi:aldehyde dehydrogenase family protein [Atopobiaceae bacterium 24-176]